jgi:hypothetical protein
MYASISKTVSALDSKINIVFISCLLGGILHASHRACSEKLTASSDSGVPVFEHQTGLRQSEVFHVFPKSLQTNAELIPHIIPRSLLSHALFGIT